MRLIDADKLMGKMWDAFNDFYSDTLCVDEAEVKMGIRILDNVKKVVDDQPTVDAAPVVRCRDCKHFTKGMAIGMCYRIPDKAIWPIMYNHFCSYGEMRKGKGMSLIDVNPMKEQTKKKFNQLIDKENNTSKSLKACPTQSALDRKNEYESACAYLDELKNSKCRRKFEQIVMKIPTLEMAQIIIKKLVREID